MFIKKTGYTIKEFSTLQWSWGRCKNLGSLKSFFDLLPMSYLGPSTLCFSHPESPQGTLRGGSGCNDWLWDEEASCFHPEFPLEAHCRGSKIVTLDGCNILCLLMRQAMIFLANTKRNCTEKRGGVCLPREVGRQERGGDAACFLDHAQVHRARCTSGKGWPEMEVWRRHSH